MTDEEKLAYDALLKEMHKADDLVEQHSGLVIAITGAAFGFAATQLENPPVVYFASVFGIVTAAEWIFKISRHKDIFNSAHSRLTNLLQPPHINTVRPIGRVNGFTILIWFASFLILMWIGLSASVYAGLILGKSVSASEVIEKTSKELSTLTGITGSKWNVISMKWDDQDHSYDMVVAADSSKSEQWNVSYETLHGRIIKYEKH